MACLSELSRLGGNRQGLVTRVRIAAGAWELIAEAQAVLAHSCIASFTVKSKKFEFLYAELKQNTQALHVKFKDTWQNVATLPTMDAKTAVSFLRLRLRRYLIAVQGEIHVSSLSDKGGPREPPSSSSPRSMPAPPVGALTGISSPSTMGHQPGNRFGGGDDSPRRGNHSVAVFGDDFGGLWVNGEYDEEMMFP